MTLKTEAEYARKKQRYDLAYTEGKPLISDAKYDAFLTDFAKHFPRSKDLRKVGAKVNGKVEVKLPIIVGSLDKLRPGEVGAWMKQVEAKTGKQHGWLVLPKLDGASLLLHYKDEHLAKAWSRGEVRQGESFGFDTTDAARLIQGVLGRLRDPKVLDPTNEYLVRGEVIIHRSIFKKNYEKADSEYKSGRNMVAGLLNANDPSRKDHLRRCTFVALQLFMKNRAGKWVRPADAHKEWVYLMLMGFTIAPHPVRYSPGHWRLRQMVKEGHSALRSVLPVHENSGSLGTNIYWDKIPSSEDEVVQRLNDIHAAVDIACDGIVIQPLNSAVFQKKGDHLTSHPAFMRAVKLEPQQQQKFECEVGKIEWKVKKRGLVQPRLILEKGIEVEGATIDHATCHSASFVLRWALKPGCKIRMIRSGGIIPRITDIWAHSPMYDVHGVRVRRMQEGWVPLQVKDDGGRWVENSKFRIHIRNPSDYIPSECPTCGSNLRWNKNKVNIFCTNAKCPGENGERILSFFRLLGVDDVAGATVQTMIKAGMNTIPKIIHGATAERLSKLERYGERKAQIVSDAIAGALKNVPLSKVMHASTCFGDEATSLGSVRLQAIIDAVGEGSIARDTALQLRTKLARKRGIGPRTIDIFLDGLNEWRRFFRDVKSVYTAPSGPKTLKDVVACWTGFRDTKAESYLLQHGGRVSGTVTKTTTVLFAESTTSGKARKADDMQIEVVPQADMWPWLKKRGEK
jgi:DNA ligase (NAD+)